MATCVFAFASCSDEDSDFRRTLDDGFPRGLVVGILPPHADGLRALLGNYHMAPGDIDCMIEHVRLDGKLADDDSRTIELTAVELDEYAKACSVDFSTLWYMID